MGSRPDHASGHGPVKPFSCDDAEVAEADLRRAIRAVAERRGAKTWNPALRFDEGGMAASHGAARSDQSAKGSRELLDRFVRSHDAGAGNRIGAHDPRL